MHIVNKLVVLVRIYEWLLSTPNFWSPAGPIGQTGPGIQYGHVIVIVAIWPNACGNAGGASPSSFTQNVFGNNQHSYLHA